MSARLTEWAIAGFAITLLSALIAHVSAGDGPEAWGLAAATACFGLSTCCGAAWRSRVRMSDRAECIKWDWPLLVYRGPNFLE
jgi:hypothetical protein